MPLEIPNAYGMDEPSFSRPGVRVMAIAAGPPTFWSSKFITHLARSSALLNSELDPSASRLLVVAAQVLSATFA